MHLVTLGLIIFGCLLVYKIFYKEAQLLDIEEKIDEIELTQEEHELVRKHRKARNQLDKKQDEIESFIE